MITMASSLLLNNDNSTIMILCNSFISPISGVGRYVYYIVKYLKYKYNFIVITMRDKDSLHIKTYSISDDNKSISRDAVYLIPKAFSDLPYFSTIPILVRSLFLRTHANIIHTHSIGQIHSDMASLLSFKKPLIYTIHGWRNATNPIAQRLYGRYESIIPLFLRGADIITVLGSKSKKYICSLLGETSLCEKKVIITPNGVDFYTVRKLIKLAKSKNIQKEEKNILFVGRLVKTKGIIDLLIAFKVLSKIDHEIKLIICGDGSLKPFIKSFIDKYDLKERVELAGGIVPWERLILEYYSRAGILVLPSYSEGLPTVLLEAMVAEVPVITTPVGDVTDIIRHGETGILVEPGNIKALAEAILTILQDKNLKRKIISNALNIAKYYNWSVIANIFDKVYSEVIE